MYRQKKGGTYVIDLRFKGIGRVRKSSGTSNAEVFARMVVCFKELYSTGRLDVLRRLQSGVLSPLEVYDAFRYHHLESLRSVDDIPRLLPHGDLEQSPLIRWLRGEQFADTTRQVYFSCLKALLTYANQSCTIGDLPRLLRQARVDYKDRPRTFNQMRTACQAYANKTQEKHSVLWAEIQKVPTLVYKVEREGNPLGIRDVWELVTKAPTLAIGKMMWTLALTGMRIREFYTDGFDVDEKEDRIVIHGQKNDNAERSIPLIDPSLMSGPVIDDTAFRRVLRKLSKRQVQLYDFRRTFARLLEESGVVESHQQIYMGHAPQTQTGAYKKPRISHHMRVEDAKKIRAYIKKEIPNHVDLKTAHQFFDLTA